MKKKIMAVCLLMIVCLLYVGCSCSRVSKLKFDDITWTESGIYVKEDGTVIEALISDFAESYLDVEELKYFVMAELDEYNAAHADDTLETDGARKKEEANVSPVSLRSIEKVDDKVFLFLEYQSVDVYNDYNHIYDTNRSEEANLTAMAVKEYPGSLDAVFVTARGGSLVYAEEIVGDADKKGYHLVKVNYGESIYVEGEIVFVSANVYVVDQNHAKTVDGEDSYIIYQ